MTSERPYANRRTVIGSLGTGAVLALAGCLDDSDDEEPETDDTDETTDAEEPAEDENGDENGEEADDDEAEQLSEPTEFPDGEECAVCNMITAEYPDWNAQLVHGSGTRTYFCSSGCLAAYYPDPLEFGDCEAPIENAWVTGYESGELLDASEGCFVRVTDSDHVDDIMMMNPTPFADCDDADAFVAGFDEYDQEDIIGLEEFDEELARLYRGRFFDDEDEEEAEQLSEPTDFPEGEECAVCNMVAAEFPDWNAQLVHGSGTRTYFCSSGCLAAYYPDPLEFGDCEAPIENAWVTDYETGDLIDGQEAYYVLVEDADHIDDIMMMNPTPFASRDDAEALVEELNAEFDADYDVDEDIVRSDAFDMELAMQYRGRFFEDDGDDGHGH